MEAIKRLIRRITSPIEKETVSFGEDDRQFVDIYLPCNRKSSKTAIPLLIFVHGGAWVSENVGMYTDLAQNIASKGIAVALPEYRLTRYKDLTPEDPNTIWHPNHLEDVYAGIQTVYEKAEDMGYTTEQTVLVGHSAGGYMSLAVALDSTKANNGNPDDLIRDLPKMESSIVKSIKAFVCVESIFSLVDMLKQYPTYNYFTTPAFYPPSSLSSAKVPYSELQKAGPETWPVYPAGSYHATNPDMPNVHIIHSSEDSLLNSDYNAGGVELLRSKGLNLSVDLQSFKGDHEDLLHTQPFWDRLISIVQSPS